MECWADCMRSIFGIIFLFRENFVHFFAPVGRRFHRYRCWMLDVVRSCSVMLDFVQKRSELVWNCGINLTSNDWQKTEKVMSLRSEFKIPFFFCFSLHRLLYVGLGMPPWTCEMMASSGKIKLTNGEVTFDYSRNSFGEFHLWMPIQSARR